MRSLDWPRIVAVWMMAGATLSGAYFLDVLPRSDLPADTWQTLLAALLPLCFLAVLAGYALLKGRETARGASLALWALQVPSIHVGSLMYGLTLGPYAYVGVFPGGIAGASVGFRPHVAFMRHAPAGTPATGAVNVLAVFAMIVVWRATRRPVSPGIEPETLTKC